MSRNLLANWCDCPHLVRAWIYFLCKDYIFATTKDQAEP